MSPHQVGLACAAVAVLAALLAQWMSHSEFFHPSKLLDIADTDPLAQLVMRLDPGFHLSSGPEHYDGVYLYAMAVDPFASGEAHNLIDLAGYRYGHPMYSWIAGILSFGHAPALPWVFWLLSLASMAVAAYLVSRLAATWGGTPWLGLVVAASPGLLFSASTALTEPFQLVLVVSMLLLWGRGRRTSPWLLGVVCVVMCLTKENLVLVALALGADLLVSWVRRTRSVRESWPQALALAAGPVALGAWLVFIRGRFTPEQLAYDDGNIGLPFANFPELLELGAALRVTPGAATQIGTTAPSGIVAIFVVLVAGTVAGLYRRDALAWLAASQLVLVSGLGWRTLLYPHEMFRIPAVALIIAVLSLSAAIAERRGPVAVAEEPSEPTPGPARAEEPGTEGRYRRKTGTSAVERSASNS